MTITPKRFYKTARAVEAEGGFTVALDERRLKTPGGRAFIAPTRALAQAMAQEWDAQTEHIVPARMPLTQFAFAAIDWTAASRDQRIEYVQSFAVTDLCCHRADSPAELVARQAEHWDALVAWGAADLGVCLKVMTGIIAAEPNADALNAVREVAVALDDFRLTALTQASGLSGSALIAFALLRGRIDSTQAFEAAALDDLWSLEKWGEDAEARARVERVRNEFMALGRYIETLADGA
jgi:chaperone required for assembly of F1-ATPase